MATQLLFPDVEAGIAPAIVEEGEIAFDEHLHRGAGLGDRVELKKA